MDLHLFGLDEVVILWISKNNNTQSLIRYIYTNYIAKATENRLPQLVTLKFTRYLEKYADPFFVLKKKSSLEGLGINTETLLEHLQNWKHILVHFRNKFEKENEKPATTQRQWLMNKMENYILFLVNSYHETKDDNVRQMMASEYTLNMQGRCHPSIAPLLLWKYSHVGHLTNTTTDPIYVHTNNGFLFDYQNIHVGDYHGRGEAQSIPYLCQNLGEAKYIAHVILLIKLITYYGRTYLLRDIFNRHCRDDPLFDLLHSITTIHQYRGQQNHFIVLSLVTTKNIGHIRDIQTLVVALSRAKFELYIFARINIFLQCFELKNGFDLLMKRPQRLHLVTKEKKNNKRILAIWMIQKFL
ncbi:hypothetical protein RFI_03328 [Reticulomyxa filosa]|uniref:DNA2/NAM7 helicase-like C-terminal domain-containing protein n=1 Tax=Reticulomyxa filosa TaxID=46433 RepID=X6P6G9_RETFI|nr:hypothetical protein RFI_03328 [Reticulomyxa filosa]|eukprot:ETO33776.1 hypothetical protein RFI_03328 [Reticulomyxa filosa]